MRILIACDVDGTFWTDEDNSEYICGIIDPEKLEMKQLRSGEGNEVGVFVVSESPFYPKVLDSTDGREIPRFPVINDQANRYHNLLKVKEKFGEADLRLYVDDQAIWKKDAEKAGFIFVDASLFADMFKVRKITHNLVAS